MAVASSLFSCTGCTYSDCTAGQDGGAIASFASKDLLLSQSHITNCTASIGGGIAAWNGNTLILSSCTLTSNKARGSPTNSTSILGGGVFASYVTAVILLDSNFTDNSVANLFPTESELPASFGGGAVYTSNYAKDSVAVMVGCTFRRNRVQCIAYPSLLARVNIQAQGGALCLTMTHKFAIIDCLIELNTIKGSNASSDGTFHPLCRGGGVTVSGVTTTSGLVSNSSFRANAVLGDPDVVGPFGTATTGGGLVVEAFSSLTLRETTFEDQHIDSGSVRVGGEAGDANGGAMWISFVNTLLAVDVVCRNNSANVVSTVTGEEGFIRPGSSVGGCGSLLHVRNLTLESVVCTDNRIHSGDGSLTLAGGGAFFIYDTVFLSIHKSVFQGKGRPFRSFVVCSSSSSNSPTNIVCFLV